MVLYFDILICFFCSVKIIYSSILEDLNLPEGHLPFYFNNYPEIAKKCQEDPNCPHEKYLNRPKACWGYEQGCQQANSFSNPSCPGDHKGWVRTKLEQINTFYKQGDFGYIKEQIDELSLLCKPTFMADSSLECSKHLRYCRGRNIMVNFTSLSNRKERIRYHMDVLSDGDIGGHCNTEDGLLSLKALCKRIKTVRNDLLYHFLIYRYDVTVEDDGLDRSMLSEETDQISPLQSWGPELRFFKELEKPLSHDTCDISIHTPTFIMKIDATVNLYHHFCDFFNLYASQHLNSSHPDTFSTDIRILIWESFPYRSNFAETWKAFTRYPVWDLNVFAGKTVCFKNVVFPLLPRMIFGLYYNTPIIWGCEKSGLFQAFSEQIIHRLKIKTIPREEGKFRVTLLSRGSSYRNILNEDQLLEELSKDSKFIVNKVVYNKALTFYQQLQITRDSDIFIGIHGAGLTHLLFLPDWAAVFELYNCEDEHCYQDLARLRGVKYITWEKKEALYQEDEGHHPDGGAHAKFTNYRFDPVEFVRLVNVAASHVQNHLAYKNFMQSAKKHDEL